MNYILRTFFIVFLLFLSTTTIFAASKPIVKMETSMGTIIIELNRKRAPASVANFLYYAKKGFYNGTIFHRVIYDFMIQGGGFDQNRIQKTTRAPIRNESNNGLMNTTGTIAMARTQDVDSATSQFYINVNDNRSLNASFGQLGYTVFGVVTEGLDVVMRIASVPVQPTASLGEHSPVEPVIIKSVTIVAPEVKKQPSEAKNNPLSKTKEEK